MECSLPQGVDSDRVGGHTTVINMGGDGDVALRAEVKELGFWLVENLMDDSDRELTMKFKC